MGGTFNTTAASSVTIVNAVGDSIANYGIYWQVAGATVFGADTLFEGNLFSNSTIVTGAGVQVDGRLLTATSTIGLAPGDSIDFVGANSGYAGGLAFSGAGSTITAVPEPLAVLWLTPLSALGLVIWRRQKRAIPHSKTLR
jgi:hypothetical protein